MKGRNTAVISIRILDSDYLVLKKLADGKGLTVSMFVRGKVEEYAGKVGNRSVNQLVNTTNILPIYNKDIHKAGDRVLIKKGKKLVEAVVPELDADGHIM